MKNFIQNGDRITWTNGGSAVASGDPVVVGSLIGVATTDIAGAATGELATVGVFELPKVADTTGHAIAQGESVIFDVSAGKFDNKDLSPGTGDITVVAVAWAAATSAATTVQVFLTGNPGTIHA